MSGTQGLNPADIVDVEVNLSASVPTAASQNIPLIVGPTPVIDVVERIRTYTGGAAALIAIAQQFGNTAPEYLCAQTFYAQTPQPQVLKIGRWASTATPAILHGGPLSVQQQQLSNFTGITTGSLKITYGSGSGTLVSLTGLTFTGLTTLAQIAAVINTALQAATPEATCTYDPLNTRFNIATVATGTTAFISFAVTDSTGVDVGPLLNLQAAAGGSIVGGIAQETPVQAATILRGLDPSWYALHFTSSVGGVWQDYDANLTTAAHVAIAQFIEACQPRSTYLISSNDTTCLLSSSTTDIAAEIDAGNFKRTTVYYSSSNAAVALEMFASFAVIDYDGSNTATIAMFKQLPGVVAETLTEAQAAALKAKNASVFVNYSDNTAFIQYGAMGSGNYFDEIHSTDALASDLQNAILSQLITQSQSYRIPQTNDGMLVLQGVCSQICDQFVTNGTIGRNLAWGGAPFGTVKTGDILPKGYYIYQAPITTQQTADRQARKAPLIQIGINLAGAVQQVSVIISVTR